MFADSWGTLKRATVCQNETLVVTECKLVIQGRFTFVEAAFDQLAGTFFASAADTWTR
jgi:hypothetical protein